MSISVSTCLTRLSTSCTGGSNQLSKGRGSFRQGGHKPALAKFMRLGVGESSDEIIDEIRLLHLALEMELSTNFILSDFFDGSNYDKKSFRKIGVVFTRKQSMH